VMTDAPLTARMIDAHIPDASSTTFGPDAATNATGDSGARAVCGIVRRVNRAQHG